MSSQSLGLIGLDRFVLTQHPTPTATASRYEIRSVADDGADGPVLAAAQQERQSYREKATFFADDTRRNPVFSFARRPQADASSFDVLDAGGRPIGQLRREKGVDGTRTTWHVETDGVRGRAQERTAGVLARLGVGSRAGSLEVVDADGRAVMSSERQRGAAERCVVTVLDTRLDARVAAALVVALDAVRPR